MARISGKEKKRKSWSKIYTEPNFILFYFEIGFFTVSAISTAYSLRVHLQGQ